MAQGSTARKPVGQQLAYLRKSIVHDGSFDTNDRVKMGGIPAGSKIAFVAYGTKEVFDGSGAVLTVGSDGTTAANIVAAGDVAEATTSSALLTSAMKLDFTEDVTVWAKLAQGTTTAPTTGEIDLVLAYATDQEGE